MIRQAFFALVVFGLVGAGAAAAPNLGSQVLAQSTPTPVPTVTFSCNFAGFNQFNNLINTGIGCGTPGPGANYPTLICTGAATCAPNSGPTPAIFVPIPNPGMPIATSTPISLTNSGQGQNNSGLWSFTGTDNSCGSSGSPGAHLIAQFNNDIAQAFGITCSGNGQFAGSILLSGLATGSPFPLCGSGNQLIVACAVAGPFPLSTSVPLTVEDSQNPNTTNEPAWTFNADGVGCGSMAPSTNMVAVFQNSAPSPILQILCTRSIVNGGGIVASGITTQTGFIDDALPTPAPNPVAVCGGFGVAETACAPGELANNLLANPPIVAVNGDGVCIGGTTASFSTVLRYICPTPMPLATNGPVVPSNTSVVTTSVPAWNWNQGNSACSATTNLHTTWTSSAATLASLDCEGHLGIQGGLVPPTYTHTGATPPATYHCVQDTVTAAGASTTVVLTGAAVFATAISHLEAVDMTGAIVVPAASFSAVGLSTFTVVTTNTHVYNYQECGW